MGCCGSSPGSCGVAARVSTVSCGCGSSMNVSQPAIVSPPVATPECAPAAAARCCSSAVVHVNVPSNVFPCGVSQYIDAIGSYRFNF